MVGTDQIQLDEEALEAVQKFIELLKKLNETGILDALLGILEPSVIGALMKLIMHPGFLKLVDRLDKIGDLLNNIEIDNIDALAPLINSAIEAMGKKPKPTGAFGMLFALRNKDAKKGLGLMVELLKALGSKY